MQKFEYFADTDETIVSDLTEEEIAQLELLKLELIAEQEQREADLAAKQAAKASAISKLSALGLEADEIAALVG
jgi:hypothetical protein